MKRYRFLRDNFAECECEMEESNIGEWVRYEDVPGRISDTPTLSAVPSEERIREMSKEFVEVIEVYLDATDREEVLRRAEDLINAIVRELK